MFLNNIHVGQRGTVVDDEWGTCPPDRFLVKMNFDNTGALYTVIGGYDLFLDQRLFAIPLWMPPLSIRDNATLHESLLYSLDEFMSAEDRASIGEAMTPIIATCWLNRLPVSGQEVWALLRAHGVSEDVHMDAVECFEFGIGVLTKVQGRAAVKRRRMPAMSKGRYLTNAERRFRLNFFGHD